MEGRQKINTSFYLKFTNSQKEMLELGNYKMRKVGVSVENSMYTKKERMYTLVKPKWHNLRAYYACVSGRARASASVKASLKYIIKFADTRIECSNTVWKLRAEAQDILKIHVTKGKSHTVKKINKMKKKTALVPFQATI